MFGPYLFAPLSSDDPYAGAHVPTSDTGITSVGATKASGDVTKIRGDAAVAIDDGEFGIRRGMETARRVDDSGESGRGDAGATHDVPSPSIAVENPNAGDGIGIERKVGDAAEIPDDGC